MAQNESTLIDRAQAYWEALDSKDIITAEQLFEVVRGPKDWNEHIRIIRGFLTRKFNDGYAFLIPGQSPPTYQKLKSPPNVANYCKKLFNFLPDGEELTSTKFMNRLPLKLKQPTAVRSFIQRAKMCGAVVPVIQDGKIAKDGKCVLLRKEKNVDKLPVLSAIPEKYKITAPKPKEKTEMKDHKISKLIEGMTPSEVGMSIFHAINDLISANQNIKIMKDEVMLSLQKTATELMALEEENKKLKDEIETLRTTGKEQTFGELFHQKQPAAPSS